MTSNNALEPRAGSGLVGCADSTLVALRAPVVYSTAGDVDVDEAAGVIKNVALMTIGPARGHGFEIDATTLEQLAEKINSDPSGMGVKCRVTHPDIDADGQMADDLMQLVGRVRNARIVGNAVRGDVYLGDFAKVVPGLGDVRAYLCSLAKHDPTALGMSAMFSYSIEPKLDDAGQVKALVARIQPAHTVVGVDFVGKPAANPNGLLSEPVTTVRPSVPPAPLPAKPPTAVSQPPTTSLSKGKSNMDAELKALLVGMGMNSTASDEEAMSYLNGLSEEQKTQLKAKFPNTQMEGKAACAAKSVSVAALTDPNRLAVDKGEQIVALEEKRVSMITKLGAVIKVGTRVVDKCIADGLDIEAARVAMLKAKAEDVVNGKNGVDPATAPGYAYNPAIRVGEDKTVDGLRETIVDAIALRMLAKQYDPMTAREKYDKAVKQIKNHGDQRTQHFASLAMPQMCQHFLATLGFENPYMLTQHKIGDLMRLGNLRRANPRVAALAESVGDFSSITLDAFNKTLRVAYLDADRSWTIWARRATAPDFKNINRVVLSESPSLISRNQGGEIKYVQLTDSKEVYTLSEYAAGIRLTRRSIINDDLDAFSRIPLLQANAAARLEDDVAYAVLTGNATLGADSIALFDSSTHKNYTSSGTALSVNSLQVAKGAMKKQKGLAGAARLELKMSFLLVPTSIEETAEQLVGSQFLIPGIAGGGSSGTPTAGFPSQGQRNPFYNKLTIVGSTRLDDDSTTKWYGAADYRSGQIDTIEVAFLQDEPEPVAKQETDFDTDDIKFAIRHTTAAKAIDYRGLYANAGA
jgi:hypothetical protein